MFARVYARLRPMMDRQGAAEHRARLVAGTAGRIVEVGAGEGANFAHYPPTVTEVVAIEPNPYLRAQAARRATAGDIRIEVVDGTAERLPVGDGSADVVVMCLVLCSVADQTAALAEAFRVLRPGGELRFYEHVAAEPGRRLARVQRIADKTVWPWLTGGCHVGRDTAAAITAAGFVIEELDRFDFPPGQPSPAAPHVLGRAIREAS
ncbi:methyltransferase domain-containing protein [Kribbella sp. CA-253562]|uniref:methyltransferase domain-containing protein n=1 Tax=Kribbella sp. CA-253562 TaxID=3239942 RepID=UPI003D93B68C